MKNQFFADRQDYFKWDMLLYLASNNSALFNNIVYVPLLTADDSSGEGKTKPYNVAAHDQELHNLLRPYASGEKEKNVQCISDIFCQLAPDMPFHYHQGTYRYEDRVRYFNSIAPIRDALVFLDPDTGMVLNSHSHSQKNTNKYLGLDSIAALSMSANSQTAFLIYQHLMNNKDYHVREIFKRSMEFRSSMPRGSECLWIYNQEVVFLLIVNDPSLQNLYWPLFKSYAQKHSYLRGII